MLDEGGIFFHKPHGTNDLRTEEIMGEPAKIIEYRPRRKTARKRKRRRPDGQIKYFNEKQIKLLRRTARDRARLAREKKTEAGVREWMVIDLLTSTGMRIAEAADVRCGDIKTGYGDSELFVRDGKGGRSRNIQIPENLKKHLKSFIQWKIKRGEPVGVEDHLVVGQRGPWTVQGFRGAIKKLLRMLDLYECGKSVHALRHSYAVEYYRRSRDLRGLQKQLGHASIQTTTIYADVTKEDIQENIRGFWN